MKNIRVFSLLVFLFLIGGCDYFAPKEKAEKKQLARVFDNYLYLEDISQINFSSLSAEDSLRLLSEFVENWVRNQLMIAYAHQNLPPNSIDIERQIQEYRNSLMIFNYEKEYVNQNIDTIITSADIEQFYARNTENFMLADDIYNIQYIKVLKETPRIDSVRYLLASEKASDRERLMQFNFQYAIDFKLEENWLDRRMITTIIPSYLIDDIDFRRKGIHQVSNEPYIYFLKVSDHKPRETIAPLSFVRENIERILLNHRKQQLVRELNNNVYLDARQKNSFEIF